jgi:hypothetical protein
MAFNFNGKIIIILTQKIKVPARERGVGFELSFRNLLVVGFLVDKMLPFSPAKLIPIGNDRS